MEPSHQIIALSAAALSFRIVTILRNIWPRKSRVKRQRSEIIFEQV